MTQPSFNKLPKLIKYCQIFVFGLFTLTNNVFAANNIPYFNNPIAKTQRVFIENNNMSANDFFTIYMSESVEERRFAETYLLGVLDATEGKLWCDYRTFKTGTIGERVYEGFKILKKSELDKRAAYVITEILSKRYPCRGK